MVGESRQSVCFPKPHGTLQCSRVLRQPFGVREQIAYAIAAILIGPVVILSCEHNDSTSLVLPPVSRCFIAVTHAVGIDTVCYLNRLTSIGCCKFRCREISRESLPEPVCRVVQILFYGVYLSRLPSALPDEMSRTHLRVYLELLAILIKSSDKSLDVLVLGLRHYSAYL